MQHFTQMSMFICLVGQLSNSSTNPNQVSYDDMMVNMGTWVLLIYIDCKIPLNLWIKFFSLMHQRLWSTEGKEGTGQGRRAIGSIHLNINSPFYGFYGQCNVVGTIKCISWFTSLGQRFTLCHFIILLS